MSNEIEKALRGHSIVDLYLNESGEELAIVIGGSNYLISVVFLGTEGDCCSHSWIEHIGNPEACHMAHFESWREVSIDPSPDSLSEEQKREFDNGELKFYFFALGTSKGETLIEMRNSSNGYYGGWIKYLHQRPFLDCNLDNSNWRKVS